jgi:hypothetical protein
MMQIIYGLLKKITELKKKIIKIKSLFFSKYTCFLLLENGICCSLKLEAQMSLYRSPDINKSS